MSKRHALTFIARLAVLAGAIPLLLHAAPGSAEDDAARYDWVPASQLSEADYHRLGAACRGAYVDPMQNIELQVANPAEAPIYIDANSTTMDGPRVTLEGDVDISQGPRLLHAQRMAYDQQSEVAELEGDVMIRQPGLLVRGTGARVNMAGNEARFEGGEFVMHGSHMRGSAERIDHRASGLVVLDNGTITSCEPYREAWRIRGERLSVNPVSRRGFGRNVWIEIGGVPVFYAPFFTFPVGSDRQSGLLAPSVTTSGGKLDFAQPFYWNLAPNYDATITPRLAGGHGPMVETEFRHLSAAARHELSLAYLPEDRGGDNPDVDALIDEGFDERLLRPYKGRSRWLFNLMHRGGDRSRWYSDIDFTRASDVDYLRDLSIASFDVASDTYLSQSATLGYRLPNWHLNLRLQAYQSLLVDLEPSYRQLPRLQATGQYHWNDWGLRMLNEVAHFTHEDPSFVTGSRAYMDYAFSWQQQRPWGFLRPEVGMQVLAYHLDEQNLRPGADANPALGTGYASLDTGLVFERNGGRQLLQPRMFYLYRPHTDHSELYNVTDPALGPSRDVNFDTTALTFGYGQLFRDRRFIGHDRLADANQLSLGVTSEWFDGQNLDPVISLSFGQVFYFTDRNVVLRGQAESESLRESDLAAQMYTQVSEHIRVSGDLLYNPKSQQLMRGSAGIRIGDGYRRHVNLAYRFVREDDLMQATQAVKQLDTTFTFPLNHQWQLVGRIFYDLDERKELDTFAGFEYDDCCYRVRVLARRWLDSKLASLVDDVDRHYDQGVTLEVDFKGLASSGERIQQLLAEHLPLFRR